MKKTIVVIVIAIAILAVVSVFFLTDSDGDGLSNFTEIRLGANFGNQDTDGDGLSDGVEVNMYRTDPLSTDSDNDGLNDGTEIDVHGTNPLAADTDNEGLGDGSEITDYGTDPLKADTDNDGLNDWPELFVHGTDPSLADTDNDGLGDSQELNLGSNQLMDDSDGDRLKDGVEASGWYTVVNGAPIRFTSGPISADSDGDGICDWAEYNTYLSDPESADTDNDGYGDGLEVLYNTDLSSAPSSPVVMETAPTTPGIRLEIDYMTGHSPSPAAIEYLKSYFENDLGVAFETTYDEVMDSELMALGVSTGSISSQELNTIESNFHDNPTSHLYVFYADELSEGDDVGGLASPAYGATMSGVFLTGRLDREKTILLHEIGHCIGLTHSDNAACAMSITNIFESPVYSRQCWSQRDLLDIWSVDEPWL